MNAALLTLLAFAIAGAWRSTTELFVVVRDVAPATDRGVSRGAAWGDFDGDGDPDLFVTRPTYADPSQLNVLYRNDSGGRFLRMAGRFGDPAGWEGAVWVDVDNDADLDLHLVGRNGAGSLFVENAGGVLTPRLDDPFVGAVTSASVACWADFDADGRLDVFVAGYRSGRNVLLRSSGLWRFESISLPEAAVGEGATRACVAGDVDGDGLPEIVIANALRPNILLRNLGNLRFNVDSTSAINSDSAYSYGLSFTDVNQDGYRDLFVANFDGPNSLYLGSERGTLEPVVLGDRLQSAASKGHTWGDFDLDGREDLYLGSGTPGPAMLNRLWMSGGPLAWRLVEEGEFASHADTSAAIAAADFDGDGDLDLFVANWGSAGSVNRVYRNASAAGNWLKVRIEGVQSNRMGVGARVSALIASGGVQTWHHRWLDLSTGYAGQNEPVIHFGLGNARRVDSLVVHWPSGITQLLGAVSARQVVSVREATR